MADPRERALQLLRLANDSAAKQSNEANAAARRLVEHLAKHKLLEARSAAGGVSAKDIERAASTAWETIVAATPRALPREARLALRLVARIAAEQMRADLTNATLDINIAEVLQDVAAVLERVLSFEARGRSAREDRIEAELRELFSREPVQKGADVMARKLHRNAARVRRALKRMVDAGSVRMSGDGPARRYYWFGESRRGT